MLSYYKLNFAALGNTVSYLIGAALAALVGLLATWVGFDRDRSFYPTVLIVIASYYVLFAVSGGVATTLAIEIGVVTLFAVAAIAGFKRSLWIVVAALAGHGIFDWFHASMISNPGVPPWWPEFCLAYDGVAAAYLAAILARQQSASGKK